MFHIPAVWAVCRLEVGMFIRIVVLLVLVFNLLVRRLILLIIHALNVLVDGTDDARQRNLRLIIITLLLLMLALASIDE